MKRSFLSTKITCKRVIYLLMICLVAGWVGYGLFGKFLIQAIYERRSLGFLNNVLYGRSEHSLEYYFSLADSLMIDFTVYILIWAFVFSSVMIFRDRRNFNAFLFGIYLCIALIFLTEAFLHLFKVGESNPLVLVEGVKYSFQNAAGIKRPIPGEHIDMKRNGKTGSVLYKVQVNIDEHHRRVVPVQNKASRRKFILFMGNSFTFGRGVEEHETLAYQTGKLAEEYMPYNYGVPGFGPFDVLALIENTDFSKEVEQDSGLMIYVYIDNYIYRYVGSSLIIKYMAKNAYYKRTPDGTFVRQGSFETGRPFLTWVYRTLDKSRILENLGIGFPLRIKEEYIESVAGVIHQIEGGFKKQYPRGEFYVLIFPGSSLADKLTYHLDRRNVKYLNYSQLLDYSDPRYFLSKYDFHPSKLTHQLVAQALVMDLKLNN